MAKKGFIAEFKEFIARGNVMDLAVGVIIGGAFQSIVNSLVNDMIIYIFIQIIRNQSSDWWGQFFQLGDPDRIW